MRAGRSSALLLGTATGKLVEIKVLAVPGICWKANQRPTAGIDAAPPYIAAEFVERAQGIEERRDLVLIAPHRLEHLRSGRGLPHSLNDRRRQHCMGGDLQHG